MVGNQCFKSRTSENPLLHLEQVRFDQLLPLFISSHPETQEKQVWGRWKYMATSQKSPPDFGSPSVWTRKIVYFSILHRRKFKHLFDFSFGKTWKLIFMIFRVSRTILTRPMNFSHHFNSDWCQKHVRRRSGGQFMTPKHSVCVSEKLSVSDIDTLCLGHRHSLSRT